MKLTASTINSNKWKEWFTDSCTFYIGWLSKGDIRLGLTIGNKEGSVDLFVITLGYDRG